MAIVVKNTNYNGEVLEQILTLAATGNEIVEKGLIMVIPGVEKKISLPRLKSGKMLQKRKEHPDIEDSKGNFNYSEKSLDPVDFMAFTVFNPRAFEQIWRKWQPKGNLVFAELPPEGQNALLAELTKQVKFELGDHFINGTYGDDDDHLMNGILTQMTKDTELIIVSGKPTTMLDKLKAVRKAIPVAIRNNPNLRIIMSVNDFDKYDDELTEREAKNASETDVNSKRYKGITFGEEAVVLDTRTNPVFKAVEKTISVEPAALTFENTGGTQKVTVAASGEWKASAAPAGFKVVETDEDLTVTAEPNTTDKDKTGTITVTLDADRSKTAKITLTAKKQGGGA